MVTDDSGLTDEDYVDIVVDPGGTPSALMAMDTSPVIFAGGEVGFYLHGIDPDGTIAKYEIDFEGTGEFETVQPSSLWRQHGERRKLLERRCALGKGF